MESDQDPTIMMDAASMHAELKLPFGRSKSPAHTKLGVHVGYPLDRAVTATDIVQGKTILSMAFKWGQQLIKQGDSPMESFAPPMSFETSSVRRTSLMLITESGKKYAHSDPLFEFVQHSMEEAEESETMPFIQGLSIQVARLVGKPDSIELRSLIVDASEKKRGTVKPLTIVRGSNAPLKLYFPLERLSQMKNGTNGVSTAIFFPKQTLPESASLSNAILREQGGFTIIVIDNKSIRWIAFCDFNPAFASRESPRARNVITPVVVTQRPSPPPPTDIVPPPPPPKSVTTETNATTTKGSNSAKSNSDAMDIVKTTTTTVASKAHSSSFGYYDDNYDDGDDVFSAVETNNNALDSMDVETSDGEEAVSERLGKTMDETFVSSSPSQTTMLSTSFDTNAETIMVESVWPSVEWNVAEKVRSLRVIGRNPTGAIPLHGTSGDIEADDCYSFGIDQDANDLRATIYTGCDELWRYYGRIGVAHVLKDADKTPETIQHKKRLGLFNAYVRLRTALLIKEITLREFSTMSSIPQNSAVLREFFSNMTTTTLRHIAVAFITASIRLRLDFYQNTIFPVSNQWKGDNGMLSSRDMINCSKFSSDFINKPIEQNMRDAFEPLYGDKHGLTPITDDTLIEMARHGEHVLRQLNGLVAYHMIDDAAHYDERAARAIGVTIAASYVHATAVGMGTFFQNDINLRVGSYAAGILYFLSSACAFLQQANVSDDHINAFIDSSNKCNNYADIISLTHRIIETTHDESA